MCIQHIKEGEIINGERVSGRRLLDVLLSAKTNASLSRLDLRDRTQGL